MKIRNANITIKVQDLDISVAFYQALGLELKNRWGNHYAQLGAPGLVIGLHPSKVAQLTNSTKNSSIGFTADNFEAAKTLKQNLSVKTDERQEEGGQFIHFTDPDGTALYFIKANW